MAASSDSASDMHKQLWNAASLLHRLDLQRCLAASGDSQTQGQRRAGFGELIDVGTRLKRRVEPGGSGSHGKG